ncbi:MAG: RNA polymerase sigma factor [Planctomycetes bacterium]|nr:RNA polymerase sigma factor [Planctomycetota bacterium]
MPTGSHQPEPLHDSADAHRRWVLDCVDQFEQPLTRFAQRLTGDWESARDVVQYVFLRLCEQQRHTIGNIAAWLYTVCHHRAIDFRRKALRLVQLETDTSADSGHADMAVCSREPDPHLTAEVHDSSQWLARLIDLLPEKQRQVVHLWSVGFAYREIAQVIGHDEPYVRVLMHRALLQMRADPEVAQWLGQNATLET